MDQDISYLQEDAKAVEEINGTALERLQTLTTRFIKEREEVEWLEEKLAEAKKRFNQTSMKDIPEVLLSAGLSEVRLADGRKVVVKEDISASVNDNESFYNFVLTRGDEDIFKTNIVLGRVPTELIGKIKSALQEQFGLLPEVSRSVHSMTLKKYIKEIIGLGLERPAEVLGERYVPTTELPKCVSVYPYYRTIIK